MARSDAERRAEQALKALIAPRENAVRSLAQALDSISAADAKIEAATVERNALVRKAAAAFEAAKAAGWKQRELVDAGLAVPRVRSTLVDRGLAAADPAPTS